MLCKSKKQQNEIEATASKGFCKTPKKQNHLNVFDEKQTTFIITRVTVEKGNNPFGITISGGIDQPVEDAASSTMAVVHTVSNNKSSPVYNKLFPGDCIISVDGESMAGMKHCDMVQLFADKVGTIVLEVKRTVRTQCLYKNFNTIMVKHQWSPKSTANSETCNEYGFNVELNSWPSFCSPDVKNVVVSSVDINGPAYGTVLPRDIIISINNQILYGYTIDEIDKFIKSCNGKMLLELLRKSKSDGSQLLTDITKNNKNGFREVPQSQMLEVKLSKESNEKYGFGIVGGVDDCPIFVANVDAFSYAEQAGIKSCSVIHRMNNKDVSFMSHDDAVKLILSTNHLELLLEYNEKLHRDLQKFINGTKSASKIKVLNHSTYRSVAFSSQSDTSFCSNESNSVVDADHADDHHLEPLRQFTIRALFDFNADSEKSLPARGLTFAFGDLLQVTNGNDDEWWQAAPLNPSGTLNRKKPMGLIPSQNLLNYRLQRKSKRVRFTPKVETINHKNTISSTSHKAAVKNLNIPTTNRSSLAKRTLSPTNNVHSSPTIDGPKKSITSCSSNPLNIDDVMYLIVEPIELDTQFKRPIFIVGSYADRIQIELEQRDSNLYQFLSSHDHQSKIPTLRQTIAVVSEQSKSGVHTLISHDKTPLDIILHNSLYIIAVMFKPPDVEWIMKRNKHLSREEAAIELNYLNSIQNKYRHYFTRIITSPDAYEDALGITLSVIKENSSNQMWIPVMNVTQF